MGTALHTHELIEVIKSTLLAFDDIIFAYVYGSFAKGDHHKYSDVDVAIHLRKPSAERYPDILGAIEAKGREINLKILNDDRACCVVDSVTSRYYR